MFLVATTITRLLCGCAVIAQAIGLDNQPQVRPEEIDAEPIEVFAGEWNWQSCPRRERQEEPLEFRVSKPERAPVEQLAQPRNSPAPPISLEPSPQSLWINEIKPIRLIHRPLNFSVIEPRLVPPAAKARDIDQGKSRIRHGDSEVTIDVSSEQLGPTMNAYVGVATIRGRRNRDLNRGKAAWPNTP